MAADPLERLSDLLFLLLNSPEPLTQTQIRAELGRQSSTAYPEGDSGERAFFRDKRTLVDEGIPVVQVDDSYTIRSQDYYLPDLGLSGEAQLALNLAATAVAFDGRNWAESAAWKLGGLVGEQDRVAVVASPDALPALFGAVAGHRRVRFTHAGRPRVVDPWALLLREGFWYLVGWYPDGDGFRFFRVDRIGGPVAEVGPVERTRPQDFDPVAAFPADPKQVGDDEVVTAELWVDVVLAAKVLAQHPAAEVVERREDGSVVIALAVSNRPAFRSWILGMLDHAQVLGPDSLRREIRSWLEQIAATGAAP